MARKSYSISIITLLMGSGIWFASDQQTQNRGQNRGLIQSGFDEEGSTASSRADNLRAARDPKPSIFGRPDRLKSRYQAWKREIPTGAESIYTVDLLPSKAFGSSNIDLSTQKQNGSSQSGLGIVTLDLASQKVRAVVEGIEEAGEVELWLLAQTPQLGDEDQGTTESKAQQVSLGKLVAKGNQLVLESDLNQVLDSDTIAVDWVALVRAGETPQTGGLLFGAPNLFQRVHFAEQASTKKSSGIWSGLQAALAIPQAWARGPVEEVFEDLVAEGEHLFEKETFDGNGRTCATCHRPDNNYTIDAKYIAKLPPYDPLFVAEYMPELNYEQNGGRRFENPVLMRKFGLILANADGFGPNGDLSTFVMRSVPHTIGMQQSLTRPARAEEFPSQRTGWGGDGAPSGLIGSLVATGSLRDFSIGAVIQHFPQTTYRRIDRDFRLPTPHELDAMEAFQLSLGRDTEIDLVAGSPTELRLANSDAEAGKVLFVSGTPTSSPPGRSCNFCHRNAGANNRSGENGNFNTGVELFLLNHPDNTGEPRPTDGGFGTTPDGTFDTPIANEDGGFGDMTFNNTSVIEAADTLPAFHNNVANTLEDVVRFYQTQEFADSRRGEKIDLDDTQVIQVAQFMRVINSIDNIESSAIPFANRAIAMLFDAHVDVYAYRRVVELAQAEAWDAAKVLRNGRIHKNDARRSITKAIKQFRKALRVKVKVPMEKQAPGLQDRLLAGIEHLERALHAMRLD